MKWISVKDRLPEAKKFVLIIAFEEDIAIARLIAENDNLLLAKGGGYYHLDDVSYWMPIPEPPKV